MYIHLSHKVRKAKFEEFYIGIYKLSFQKDISGYFFFLLKLLIGKLFYTKQCIEFLLLQKHDVILQAVLWLSISC